MFFTIKNTISATNTIFMYLNPWFLSSVKIKRIRRFISVKKEFLLPTVVKCLLKSDCWASWCSLWNPKMFISIIASTRLFITGICIICCVYIFFNVSLLFLKYIYTSIFYMCFMCQPNINEQQHWPSEATVTIKGSLPPGAWNYMCATVNKWPCCSSFSSGHLVVPVKNWTGNTHTRTAACYLTQLFVEV